MAEEGNGKNQDKIPERPLECTECKKPIVIYYSEVIGNVITRACMCAECPELKKRLYGTPSKTIGLFPAESKTGLACGNCGTTLDTIRVGGAMGCSECYQVFADVILPEMQSMEKLPARLVNSRKTLPFHIGRAPGEIKEIDSSLRLLALNEALNETLKREDYEQAAWLRDQIKALTEPPEKKNDQ